MPIVNRRNKEALTRAIDIFLDRMRPFFIDCLGLEGESYIADSFGKISEGWSGRKLCQKTYEGAAIWNRR